MANATTNAAANAKTKAALAKILRQRNNENSAGFFAVGMVGLMVLFMIFHWIPFHFKHCEVRNGQIKAPRLPISVTRKARSFLLLKVPGFTFAGHALLFLVYLATCITVSFVDVDWSTLNGWAKRLGWVAVANLAFITFLGLKNTPLAFLTAYSYERLNVLHQIGGYATVFWSMLHAVVYITAWSKSNSLYELLETSQVVGMVAGLAMLLILGTASLLRKLRYEVFYIVHILMFMLILVTVGLHRPDFAKKTIIITISTASIWIADRILRFSKISLFSFGNAATITPLPHGGTRIVLRKAPSPAVVGSHCFLWIPAIRSTETHPFTIVSTKPLEFVVAAYDGFTRDLHAFAMKNPGQALKASIDGPYGTVPDFAIFEKVVFIAGGSGASFTCGVAVDMLRKLRESRKTAIEFIWVVREQESIDWFAKELQELSTSPLVNLHIHSTRPFPVSSTSSPTSRSSSSTLPNIEKTTLSISEPILTSPIPSQDFVDTDVEKQPATTSRRASRSLSIELGRPDVASIITDIVEKADRHDRVAVAACGPDSLMQVTRRAVADNIRIEGPSLELYCEQFGW